MGYQKTKKIQGCAQENDISVFDIGVPQKNRT